MARLAVAYGIVLLVEMFIVTILSSLNCRLFRHMQRLVKCIWTQTCEFQVHNRGTDFMFTKCLLCGYPCLNATAPIVCFFRTQQTLDFSECGQNTILPTHQIQLKLDIFSPHEHFLTDNVYVIVSFWWWGCKNQPLHESYCNYNASANNQMQ